MCDRLWVCTPVKTSTTEIYQTKQKGHSLVLVYGFENMQ